MKYIGSLDQGTSSTRFMIFDHGGKVVGQHQIEHRQILPQAGWVEHDANEIWERAQEAIVGALKQADILGSDLAGIGITNQRETTVVWDVTSGQPLSNAIVWQDTRTAEFLAGLTQDEQRTIGFKTGLTIAPYFAGSKMHWLIENSAEVKSAIASGTARFGTVDSWLLWNLSGGVQGGVHFTDVTNASRTLLMNLETLQAMADTASVCEHLHYPLQSGSDRVLSLMHRGYTAERYMERLADARRLIPDLSVTTDIIVGFPGETEADFQCTLEIAAEAMFDNTFEYIFSPREGTQAADMTEHFIDPAIVSDRFDRLKVVVEHSALIKHEARIGRIEEVVVQGPSRRNPNVYSGRTRQYKLVHFSSDVALRPGTYATVEITKAAPHFLTGFLVDVLQMATHKIRIPIVSV